MPTVPLIHQRGDRASQPAATAVTVGALYFVSDEGVTERSNGSAWEVYSGAGIGAPSPPSPPGATLTTFLVSGGQVVWESAYTFRVSAADYYISGTRYTSAEDTASLAAAHATLDRLDVIALDTSGAVVVLAGTAASTPSEPSVDPAQYLKLAIVFVAHATTTPVGLDTMVVYAEAVGPPLEWTWTSSGASIVVNAATTPHVGTKCIDGTNVVAGVYAQGTIGSGSIDPTDYDHLLLFIRSKAAWNSSRGLLVTLRLSEVLVGAAVQIRRSGTFGFDSTLLSDYQMVAIPTAAFAVPQGASITNVRLEDFGGAIGFFIDDVSFQVGATTAVGGGLTQDQADARYAPLVHAARHSSGGADAVPVTALAGFPGGTSTFLRADGTFASASGGAPAAHKTSHEAGGSDVLTALDAGVITTGTLASARLATQQKTRALTVVFGTGSAVITAGQRTYLSCPYTGTITGARLLAVDASVTSGSIVIDVWKDTYATYPPVVGDSITASAKPTLSSATKSEDTTLTGWTTAVTAGDVFGFTVDSASLVTQVALQLTLVVS